MTDNKFTRNEKDEVTLHYETSPADSLTQRVNVALEVRRKPKAIGWTNQEANTRAMLWDSLDGVMLDYGNWTLDRNSKQFHFYTGELTQEALEGLLAYAKDQSVDVNEGMPEIEGNPLNKQIPKEHLGNNFLYAEKPKPPEFEGAWKYGFHYGHMRIVPFRRSIFGQNWEIASTIREFYKQDPKFKEGARVGTALGILYYAFAAACAAWFAHEFR